MDFHDDLIKFSYERQLKSDPENTPYYLEALQGIAAGRKSEDLQTLVAIESSSGKISTSDVRAAYEFLGLEIKQPFLDDDFIIGSFQSRIADAPRQDSELRRALLIVGQDRSSQKIQSLASKSKTSTRHFISATSGYSRFVKVSRLMSKLCHGLVLRMTWMMSL